MAFVYLVGSNAASIFSSPTTEASGIMISVYSKGSRILTFLQSLHSFFYKLLVSINLTRRIVDYARACYSICNCLLL